MSEWRTYGRFKLAPHLRVIVEIGCREDEPPGQTKEDDLDTSTDTAEALRRLLRRLRRLLRGSGC